MKTIKYFGINICLLAAGTLLFISCSKEDLTQDGVAPDATEGFERIPSLNVALPDYVHEENTIEFLKNASEAELRKYQNAYIVIDYLTQLEKIETVADQEKGEVLDWNLSQYLNETQLQRLNTLLIPASNIAEKACIRRIYEMVCETRRTTCYRNAPVRYAYPHPLAPRIRYYRKVPYSCYRTTCRNKLIRVERC